MQQTDQPRKTFSTCEIRKLLLTFKKWLSIAATEMQCLVGFQANGFEIERRFKHLKRQKHPLWLKIFEHVIIAKDCGSLIRFEIWVKLQQYFSSYSSLKALSFRMIITPPLRDSKTPTFFPVWTKLMRYFSSYLNRQF